MPSKKPNDAKFTVQTVADIQADTLLLISPIPVAHYYKEGEDQTLPASGNIEVGDVLAVDENGDFVKSEKYAVSYIALDGNVVTKIETVELTNDQLLELMVGNPTARVEIKASGYDALKIAGVAPNDSVIS